MKHLITSSWKTWANWYLSNIIITTINTISVNIICMAALVKRYSKTIWKDVITQGTKNQVSRRWWQEGAWQNQIYKNRIPTTFTFSFLRDFEYVLRKQDSCEPSSLKSFTILYKHHVPCGSCIYVKCSNGRYFKPSLNSFFAWS